MPPRSKKQAAPSHPEPPPLEDAPAPAPAKKNVFKKPKAEGEFGIRAFNNLMRKRETVTGNEVLPNGQTVAEYAVNYLHKQANSIKKHPADGQEE